MNKATPRPELKTFNGIFLVQFNMQRLFFNFRECAGREMRSLGVV